MFNAPLIAAGALAPALGAGIADVTGSYPVLFAILAAAAAAGAALAAAAPVPAPASAGQPPESSDAGEPRREEPDTAA